MNQSVSWLSSISSLLAQFNQFPGGWLCSLFSVGIVPLRDHRSAARVGLHKFSNVSNRFIRRVHEAIFEKLKDLGGVGLKRPSDPLDPPDMKGFPHVQVLLIL